ncbi:MAG: T9SS type A sorting domain-containing protein [Saprospiraceae bacterium]
MKHLILCIVFSTLSIALFAQSDKSCINCGSNSDFFSNSSYKTTLNVYPNPTSDYIGINDDSDRVVKIEFYNLTGRQMKSFPISRAEKVNILDLPNGVYFVRLIDKNNHIVTTQRVTKR